MKRNSVGQQLLNEYPQLKTLETLGRVLERARRALLEVHDSIWDEHSEECYHGIGAEYAVAMVHQITALDRTIDGYVASLERENLGHWRRKDTKIPDQPF